MSTDPSDTRTMRERMEAGELYRAQLLTPAHPVLWSPADRGGRLPGRSPSGTT
ncbi:hypothetical protein RHODO2019_10335 [Rhodococcus antarcticus]|uniref:Uncharacterized protein n=1 Tax=Rhodococcus antarcticus TaxID=2987751 RepID=A0ABY6NW68_9NOCA|nr:hypothetical protein RHODO2019_10335 [Rhodococcus antarcticus]